MIANEIVRPLIEVFYIETAFAQQYLKKIAEGIEEEGVPYQFRVQTANQDNVVALSCGAASCSLLEVGIGMDQSGNLALHYVKLPDDTPLFKLSPPYSDLALRRFGSHAARLVKGLPFRLEEE